MFGDLQFGLNLAEGVIVHPLKKYPVWDIAETFLSILSVSIFHILWFGSSKIIPPLEGDEIIFTSTSSGGIA